MDTEEHIRVLIADDSFFIRRYLVELLHSDPNIEIVGTASTGDEVVELAAHLHPDVITMDYNMPGKNGIEAAASIMLGAKPLPSIIMLSAFDGDSGEEMRRALLASGAEVITKPSGEVSLDIEKIAASILERIKVCGHTQVSVRKALAHIHHDKVAHVPMPRERMPSRIIVIGASTGGPPLVEQLLSLLNPSGNMAVVIVQHMSKYFTELFAERLNRVTQFSTRQAESEDPIIAGSAVVVPGGEALVHAEDEQADPETLPRFFPVESQKLNHEDTIDVTMKTIATAFGNRTIGVLLSGMGTDGADGLKEIHIQGGLTIVQEPKSAIVSAMPLHAIHGGAIDQVLSIEHIADFINGILEKDTDTSSHDTIINNARVEQ